MSKTTILAFVISIVAATGCGTGDTLHHTAVVGPPVIHGEVTDPGPDFAYDRITVYIPGGFIGTCSAAPFPPDQKFCLETDDNWLHFAEMYPEQIVATGWVGPEEFVVGFELVRAGSF